MRQFISVGVIAFALLGLTGCVTVQKQAYNKEVSANIKSIAITSGEKPEEYDIVIVAHPGLNFGLIGGLIAAAEMQGKSTKLTQSLDPKATKLQERLAQKLSESLTKDGYQSSLIKVDDDLSDQTLPTKLRSKVSTNALLLLNMHAKYVAAGTSSNYIPYVVVEVKAIDNTTGKMLYQDTISYGYTFTQSKTVHLSAPADYQFKDMDALVADPTKTREGLYAGIDAIALQIATDLEK